ncbi:MAG: hypothetical protein ACYTG5_16480 [Planctomycetota bacterium]
MKKKAFPVPALLLALVLLSPAAAQDEIIVDAAGGGDYTALQPAIDAAEPWQVIRVRHGVYEGAVIRKSVRLLGEPFQFVNSTQHLVVELTSPILIRDLPAGRGCVITDVAADPIGKQQDFDDLIDAKNCAGAIHLAFTHNGNILVDDCAYVTITDHFFYGRFKIKDSTVVASNCVVWEYGGHVIDLFNSNFFASFLLTKQRKDGCQTIRVDGGSRFVADFNSAISGGGLGVEPFTIVDGTVDDRRREALVFNGNRGLFPTQFTDYLLFELYRPLGTVQAEAIAASLTSMPNTTPQGEYFLDPKTLQILRFRLGFSGERVRVYLPAILKPSRYFNNGFFSRRALPDARLQGIPVAFQGAYLVDGEVKYSLPLALVL